MVSTWCPPRKELGSKPRVVRRRTTLILDAYLGFSYIGCTPSGDLLTLAKVGVEGSNPFARSKVPYIIKDLARWPF